MRITLDPKKQFIQAGQFEAHNELTGSFQVQATMERAFAHFCLTIHAEGPMGKSDAFSQIEGARKFIDMWLNFGRTVEPVKTDSRELKPIK